MRWIFLFSICHHVAAAAAAAAGLAVILGFPFIENDLQFRLPASISVNLPVGLLGSDMLLQPHRFSISAAHPCCHLKDS